MKRMIQILICVSLINVLLGCGNTKPNQPQQETNQPKEGAKQQSKYPFPENAKLTGKGKVSVQTPSGDSATGTTPVLIVPKDTTLTQIGYTLEGFDGSREVFVFINKIFNQAQQAGEMFQGNLDLQGDLLKPGDYTVSAIQFEGNDPKSGKVTHYSETKYTVKQGS